MGCRSENRIQRISLFYDNIPAFFFLFGVLLLLFSTTTLAYPDDETMENYVMGEISSPSGNQSSNAVYFYQLYNLCSGHHVSVRQRRIQANAKRGSRYAWLRIEPFTFGGRIRIRSNTSLYYLCFNSNGSLTVKRSAEGRNSSCTFVEHSTAVGYYQFQSDANSNWLIGFNRKGKRLVGNQWQKRTTHSSKSSMNCFKFMRPGWKKQTPNGTVDLQPPQWAGKDDNRYAVEEAIDSQRQRRPRKPK